MDRAELEIALASWAEVGSKRRREMAQAIAKLSGLDFVGMHDASGLAMFDRDGVRLHLIPGGRAELGWERGGVDEQWLAWLDRRMTAPRLVELRPYLVEVEALARSWEDVRRADVDTHWAIESYLRDRGFRLLTPDEWEFACSGGRRRLFRWGDDWPEAPNVGDVVGGPALDENGFGLRFSTNPHFPELTADPGAVRLGDGGEISSGGAPPKATWVTQMTAYQFDLRYDSAREDVIGGALVRRGLSVFAEDTPPVREFVPPDPRTDPEAADRLVDRLIQRYPGHRVADEQREELQRRIPEIIGVLEGHPNNAYLLRLCCHLLRRAYRDEEALAAGHRALRIERTWENLTALAAAYRAVGDVEKSKSLFDEAYGLDPKDFSPLLDIAQVYEENERFDEAIATYERILAIDPDESWSIPALAYLRASYRGEAKAHADLAAWCENNPDDDYARDLLARLSTSSP